MKLHGQKLQAPNLELIVIPRGGDVEDIILHAAAVPEWDEFYRLCPSPTPPSRIVKGGRREFVTDDPDYKAACIKHDQLFHAWLILTSLRLGSPEFEFETVDYNSPDTWLGWVKELKEDAHFSHIEIQRVVNGCYAANALNEKRVEEARSNFLRGREAQSERSTSLSGEPNSTPSGAPAQE